MKRTKHNPTKGMTKQEVTEYWINKGKEKFGNSFDYSLVNEISNKKTPCKIICKKHGTLETSFYNHLASGTGCPQCGEKKLRVLKTFTHDKFLEKLNEIQPDRDWEVIGKYEHNQIPIRIKDKYGECLIPPGNLLQRSKPSVKTAVDKTEYTINKFKEKWGDRYDYSKFKYFGARVKSTIICRLHGEFELDANMHLSSGHGCNICGNLSGGQKIRGTTEKFIIQAKEKYGDKFTYEKTNYVFATENVTITCPKHGDFEQTPNKFLNGQICPTCTYKDNPQSYHLLKKKRNNSVLYVIECYNEEERFIKIGVTSKNVKARFKDKNDMPYNYTVLREFRYANIDASDALETEFLKFTKSAVYVPKLNFSGRTEARIINIKNAFLEYFDYCIDELYLHAFINFSTAYGGVFDICSLMSGEYNQIEIDSVLKGFEIYNKLNSAREASLSHL